MDSILSNNDQDVAEPELPQLPPPDFSGATHSRHAQIMSSEAFHLGTSSDPPAFSSDDVAPSAENYSAKRKKPRRIGPWWQSSGTKSQLFSRAKKRGMQRNYDSGVFMGSEASFTSSDIPESEIDRLSTHANEDIDAASVEDFSLHRRYQMDDFTERQGARRLDTSAASLSQHSNKRRMSDIDDDEEEEEMLAVRKSRRLRLSLSRHNPHAAQEQRVLKIVEEAVENGKDTVDLDGELIWMDTAENKDLVNRLFHPLHHLIKTRRYDDTDRFEELVPDLRLYINSNNLQSLPPEIYKLKNLTSLSLRNNKLQTLEPAIANWQRLTHLNLSSNRLRWLPIEIYRLPALTELHMSYHWFAKPVDSAGLSSPSSKRPSISQISYLDTRGRPIPKSPPRPSETRFWKPSPAPFEPEIAERGCRSLIDLCVASAAKYLPRDRMDEVRNEMSDYTHLLKLVEDGVASYDAGGQSCLCGRKFMVPRAEWFDWIAVDGAHHVPRLHWTCSWRCAQDYAVAYGQEPNPGEVNVGWDWSHSDS